MPYYRFTLRNGDLAEELGGLTLADETEALAHGKGVIRDLMREAPQQYAGCTIEVSEGGRSIGIVQFD